MYVLTCTTHSKKIFSQTHSCPCPLGWTKSIPYNQFPYETSKTFFGMVLSWSLQWSHQLDNTSPIYSLYLLDLQWKNIVHSMLVIAFLCSFSHFFQQDCAHVILVQNVFFDRITLFFQEQHHPKHLCWNIISSNKFCSSTTLCVELLFLWYCHYCAFTHRHHTPSLTLKISIDCKRGSTYHFKMCNALALIVSTNSLIPFRYFIRRSSFSQSSISGSFTHVQREAIHVLISGHARFFKNRPCAVVVWKASAFPWSNFCPNKSWDAGVNVMSFLPNVIG